MPNLRIMGFIEALCPTSQRPAGVLCTVVLMLLAGLSHHVVEKVILLGVVHFLRGLTSFPAVAIAFSFKGFR